MSPDDAITRILGSLRLALTEIPRAVEALRGQEVCGESASGSVRVFYSPFGDLNRVEVDPDFLRGAGGRRLEDALLDAFQRAESAAESAREEFSSGLTLLGIPVGKALRGGSIAGLLPPPDRVSEVFKNTD
jgi:DNA-binding protein YbaB